MVKSVIIALVLLASACTQALTLESCKDWSNLSKKQKSLVRFAKNYGDQHGLGWTMAAISLKESDAGEYRLNYKSDDFGLFQVNIDTASNQLGLTNYFKKVKLAERLVHDDELGAYLALNVLTHFNKVHNDWRKMVKSYNRGNRWTRNKADNESASKYLRDISKNVNKLKECM